MNNYKNNMLVISTICISVFTYNLILENVGYAQADEPAFADEEVPNVLILNSYHHGYHWSDRIMDAIRKELYEDCPSADIHLEYMDAIRYVSAEMFPRLFELYKDKYEGLDFDVIVCSDNNAFEFLLEYRDRLFPNVPIVFCGVGDFSDEMIAGLENITGIIEEGDAEFTAKLALSLHPSANQAVVISDQTTLGFPLWEEVRKAFAHSDRQIELVHYSLTEYTFEQLLQKVEELGDESVVFLLSLFEGVGKPPYFFEKGAKELRQHCRAPIYIFSEVWFGYGPVGGNISDPGLQGKVAGGFASRVLAGEHADSIPIVRKIPPGYMFDYAQLKHFGISEKLLPEGSKIKNKPQSFYENYKGRIRVVVAVIMTLTTLVVLLSVNILRRQRAEKALKESELKFRSFVETSADLIFLLNSTGEIEYVSSKVYQLYGYKPEELIGKHLRITTPISDVPIAISAVNKIFAGESVKNLELNQIAKDGGIVPTEINAAPVERNGNVVGVQGVMRDITERKKAQQAMKESEEKYRALFENIAEGILVVDIETFAFQYANPAICKMLGYTEEELTNMSMSDIHPKQDLEHVYAQFRLQAKGEKTLASDIPCLKKDGQIIYTDVSTARVVIEEKQCAVGFFTDITEQKRAAEEIRKFKTISDQANYGNAISDLDGKLLYVNETFAAMHGCKPVELIGKNLSVLHTPEQMSIVDKLNKRLKEQGNFKMEEVWHKRKDGSTFPTLMNATIIMGEKSRPLFLSASVVDITERKMAEQELQRSQRRQKAILDTIPDVAWLKDVDCRYIAVNEAYGRLCGKNPEDFIGKTDVDIWDDERAQQYIRGDREVMESGERIITESQWRDRKGDVIWMELIRTPVFNEQGLVVGTSGIAHNITGRIKTKQILQDARDRLEARVQQRTADLARANLELRSEIKERKKIEQKLLAYQKQLQNLASELSLAEERLRRRIATEVHDHIGQNLAISKIKAESLSESADSPELAEALGEISSLLGETIESTRELTFELSPPVLYELGFKAAVEWLVRKARERDGLAAEFEDDGKNKPLDTNVRVFLFQAVRELLVNVAKHARANQVKVSSRRVNNKIHVDIEDDGVGFDVSRLDNGDYVPAGFGLFNIRERLGQIGGSLVVKSKVGRGTLITMTAPFKSGNKITKEGQK